MKQRTHFYKNILSLVICLLCLYRAAFAQAPQEFKGTVVINASAPPLGPVLLPSAPEGIRYQLEGAKLRLTLDLGEDYKLGNMSFDCKLRLSVSGTTKGNTSVELASSIMMEITQKNPEGVFLLNLASKINDLQSVSIKIIEVISSGSSPSVTGYINANLRLTVAPEIKYHIDVRDNSDQTLVPEITRLSADALKNRVQTFNWSTGNIKFPAYEFQLLKLFNKGSENISDPKVIDTEVDWTNALSIETQTNHLTITLAEGTGYYVWRVRPIGNYYDGGISNPRNWGGWSVGPAQKESIKTLSSSHLSAHKHFIYFVDPDEDINWIYSRTFTENNKVSENISYANGLLQVNQSQVHLQSNDKTLVSQSVTDFSGRPALVTMPAPVQIGGLTGYQKGLVKTSDGKLYTAHQFDKEEQQNDPPKIKDTEGAFQYYSDKNEDISIPDAEGYPFTRTLYQNDGTNRVVEQSGVGKTHALGKQSDGRGRTIRTSYGNPTEEEMIRIFGDEAPAAASVLKTITFDANNTASVTYTSKEGKVIATSLTVNPEDNLLEELPKTDDNIDVTSKSFDNDYQFLSKQFVSSKRITFSQKTKVNIGYTLPCDTKTFGCLKINANCQYEVQIFIYDLSSGVIYKSGQKPLDCSKGIIKIDDIRDWSPALPDNSLPAGTFIIKKVLTSKANSSIKIKTAVDDSGKEIKPLVSVFTNWLSSIKSEMDFDVFYRSTQALGDSLDKANKTGNYTPVRTFSSPLGQVGLNKFNFNGPEGKKFTIKMNNPYLPDDPTKEKPTILTITGGCCGDITVPLVYFPPIVCHTADEIRQNPALRPDFWGYATTYLDPYLKHEEKTLGDYLKGYNQVSLNTMVYYMLTDKYYTGAYKPGSNKLQKPDGTLITEADKKEQYTCIQLWSCWKSVVNSMKDALEQAQEDGEGNSIHGGMKENDEAEGDKDKNTKDNHFDNEGAKMGGGFIMKMILKNKLSKRIKKAEGVDDNGNGGNRIKITYDVMEQFLNCAGYKFASIVEDKNALSSYVLPEDLSPSKAIAYNQQCYYYHNQVDSCRRDTLVFPYITNLVYAFKYFQYDAPNYTDKSYICPKYLGIEVGLCYDNFKVKFNMEPNSDICENPCGLRTHQDWNYEERVNMYLTLKNYSPPKEGEQEPDDNAAEVSYAKLDSAIHETFKSMKDSCLTDCKKRRDEILMKVTQAFLDNCYVIGGCPTDVNVILKEDIEAIVDSLVAGCKGQCEDIFTHAYNNDYPKIEPKNCYVLNAAATGFDKKTNILVPTILPTCDRLQYDQLRQWEFLFALEDDESRCTCFDGFSDIALNAPWRTIDKDPWPGSEAANQLGQLYITSTGVDTLNVIVPPTNNEYQGISRDDLTGDFEVSVKIVDYQQASTQGKAGILVANDARDFTKGGYAFVALENGSFTFQSDLIAPVGNVDKIDKTGINTVKFPCWLKLKKVGNKFSAYYKTTTSAPTTPATNASTTNAANNTASASKAKANGNSGGNGNGNSGGNGNGNSGGNGNGNSPNADWVQIGNDITPLQTNINSQIVLFNAGFSTTVESTVIMDDFDCGKTLPNKLVNEAWMDHPQADCDAVTNIPKTENGVLMPYSPSHKIKASLN